jgi:hypothetical protein
MGGVNYPDKKANGGIITALRLGLANGSDVEGKIDLMGDLSKEDKKTFAELKKLLFDATIKDRPGYAQNMLEAANPFDDKDADSKGSQERARAFDRGNKKLIYGIISTKNDPKGREEFVEEFTENYENMMYPAGRMAEGGIARLGLANGSLDPDELAALKEEVKQNPTMVNEITDIEFGVNKPGPATDQGPYPMDNEKRDTIVDMLNMGTDIAVIKEITKATDKEMDEAIDFFKYGAAGFPIPSFDNSGKMTDDGLYKGRESRPESKANGGVAGILKV